MICPGSLESGRARAQIWRRRQTGAEITQFPSQGAFPGDPMLLRSGILSRSTSYLTLRSICHLGAVLTGPGCHHIIPVHPDLDLKLSCGGGTHQLGHTM